MAVDVVAPVETSGYRRLLAHDDPNAVSWWYVARFPDGHVFARGGRCRRSRLARTLIHRARIQARVERVEEKNGVGVPALASVRGYDRSAL